MRFVKWSVEVMVFEKSNDHDNGLINDGNKKQILYLYNHNNYEFSFLHYVE